MNVNYTAILIQMKPLFFFYLLNSIEPQSAWDYWTQSEYICHQHNVNQELIYQVNLFCKVSERAEILY